MLKSKEKVIPVERKAKSRIKGDQKHDTAWKGMLLCVGCMWNCLPSVHYMYTVFRIQLVVLQGFNNSIVQFNDVLGISLQNDLYFI